MSKELGAEGSAMRRPGRAASQAEETATMKAVKQGPGESVGGHLDVCSVTGTGQGRGRQTGVHGRSEGRVNATQQGPVGIFKKFRLYGRRDRKALEVLKQRRWDLTCRC